MELTHGTVCRVAASDNVKHSGIVLAIKDEYYLVAVIHQNDAIRRAWLPKRCDIQADTMVTFSQRDRLHAHFRDFNLDLWRGNIDRQDREWLQEMDDLTSQQEELEKQQDELAQQLTALVFQQKAAAGLRRKKQAERLQIRSSELAWLAAREQHEREQALARRRIRIGAPCVTTYEPVYSAQLHKNLYEVLIYLCCGVDKTSGDDRVGGWAFVFDWESKKIIKQHEVQRGIQAPLAITSDCDREDIKAMAKKCLCALQEVVPTALLDYLRKLRIEEATLTQGIERAHMDLRPSASSRLLETTDDDLICEGDVLGLQRDADNLLRKPSPTVYHVTSNPAVRPQPDEQHDGSAQQPLSKKPRIAAAGGASEDCSDWVGPAGSDWVPPAGSDSVGPAGSDWVPPAGSDSISPVTEDGHHAAQQPMGESPQVDETVWPGVPLIPVPSEEDLATWHLTGNSLFNL